MVMFEVGAIIRGSKVLRGSHNSVCRVTAVKCKPTTWFHLTASLDSGHMGVRKVPFID